MKKLLGIGFLVTMTAGASQLPQIDLKPGESQLLNPDTLVQVTCQTETPVVCTVGKNVNAGTYEVYIGNRVAETTLSLNSAVRVAQGLYTSGMCRLSN